MSFRIIIPVALILLGAGLYGLSGNILNKKPEPIVEVINDIPMVTVWKAKQPLKSGDPITREVLVRDKMPEDEASSYLETDALEFEFLPGLIAKEPIGQNQLVSRSRLLAPDQEGYIELTIAENKVPYPISVDPETIIGGVINHGSLVDVVALSSLNQNLANSETVQEYQTFTLSPIVTAVKVLQVKKSEINNKTNVTLILELSRKEIATVIIAKKIAQLEVHKSTGKAQAELLQANSGDVLPTYRAIKEFRAGEATVK